MIDDHRPDESREHREFLRRYASDRFFLTSLESDVDRCEQMLKQAPNDQFCRRTLVRTVLAELEGLAASALDWARYYASDDSLVKDKFSPAERLFLGGETAKLNDSGVVKVSPNREHPSREGTMKLALRLVGRGADSFPDPNFKSPGWEAVDRALKIRDRLMHPKTADYLEVTNEDVEHVRAARRWFVGQYTAREGALSATLAKGAFEGIESAPIEPLVSTSDE